RRDQREAQALRGLHERGPRGRGLPALHRRRGQLQPGLSPAHREPGAGLYRRGGERQRAEDARQAGRGGARPLRPGLPGAGPAAGAADGRDRGHHNRRKRGRAQAGLRDRREGDRRERRHHQRPERHLGGQPRDRGVRQRRGGRKGRPLPERRYHLARDPARRHGFAGNTRGRARSHRPARGIRRFHRRGKGTAPRPRADRGRRGRGAGGPGAFRHQPGGWGSGRDRHGHHHVGGHELRLGRGKRGTADARPPRRRDRGRGGRERGHRGELQEFDPLHRGGSRAGVPDPGGLLRLPRNAAHHPARRPPHDRRGLRRAARHGNGPEPASAAGRAAPDRHRRLERDPARGLRPERPRPPRHGGRGRLRGRKGSATPDPDDRARHHIRPRAARLRFRRRGERPDLQQPGHPRHRRPHNLDLPHPPRRPRRLLAREGRPAQEEGL
ncbi:MAG: Cobalt-zinc-cadmium resistance protein CzcA; Cation efflux system protein CusA, partial [uncultured Rubrobacteraceae bacterium]